ncbi:MAG: ABC transporter permease [Deltaproteobacteria bacterium]|nr:ABC transporter permease [Deltaproteobacteria bacterium]MBW2362010.1 ABC transporter permease [Deltaproteobacteria bacterium]
MAPPETSGSAPLRFVEAVGRSTLRAVEQVGFGATLVGDSAYWLIMGRRRGQVVRPQPVFAEMMEIGIRAIPIVTMLAVTIGIMLAIQGIYQLSRFGAETQVVVGVAFGMTREFAPLITGILIAGRSGSALAARLGTMTINQEIDALEVMGVNPTRFLVVPSLVAMLIMLPALVVWADIVSLLGAGLYISAELGMNMSTYVDQTLELLSAGDLLHGLEKSLIFAVLITTIGIADGASVEGGAEGVGRVTTNAVVHGITAIVLTDMIFAFATTRS